MGKGAARTFLKEYNRGRQVAPIYPDDSLFDGAAAAASAGFLDWDNVPAWDTWVYYGRDSFGERKNWHINFLVSWIPPELIRHVNGGIEVNPEICIEWASQIDRPFTRTLKEHKLLY